MWSSIKTNKKIIWWVTKLWKIKKQSFGYSCMLNYLPSIPQTLTWCLMPKERRNSRWKENKKERKREETSAWYVILKYFVKIWFQNPDTKAINYNLLY